MDKKNGWELYSVEQYAKLYYVIKKGDEERWYTANLQKGECLHFEYDEKSGWPVPTNALQEYTQKIPQNLTKELQKFKKDFKEYLEAYWDLVKVDQPPPSGFPRKDVPWAIAKTDRENMYALLMHIKSNSYNWEWLKGSNRRQAKPWEWNDQRFDLWMRRFKTYFLDRNEDKLELVAVPLGTPTPQHKYGSDVRRKQY